MWPICSAQADDAEALEVYQDLLDVTRDFLAMINVLRNEFAIEDNDAFNTAVDDISELFTEMSEVMENEDWILLADILEYDFLPVTGSGKPSLRRFPTISMGPNSTGRGVSL